MVSIIVPIYNVEKYIERCVRSIQDQIYQDIEIILVDDGSPDKSGEIIERMATDDSRIHVVHKKNGGVSSARNAGLNIAKGSWVTFVDGDDWVERDYVSYLLSLVENGSSMIGMGKNYYSINNLTSTEKYYFISAEEAQAEIFRGDIFVAVWNKIYNRSFLDNNNLRFNEDIWYGEGMLFNTHCLQHTDKVAIGERSVYHQTFNPNSAMRDFNLESNYCGLKSMELQGEIIKYAPKSVKKEWRYHKYCFNRSIIDGLVRSEQVGSHPDAYIECKKDLRRNLWIPLTSEKSIKKNIIWILYCFFPDYMAKLSARRFFSHVKGGVILNLFIPEAALPAKAIGGVC